MSNVTSTDIKKMKDIIASQKSFLGNQVSLGVQFGWIISNLSNHISDYTVPINDLDEAKTIIEKVTGETWSDEDLNNTIATNDRSAQLYLHLGAVTPRI